MRWHYWENSFRASYEQTHYKVVIFVQMGINLTCVGVLFTWQVLRGIKLNLDKATTLLCCLLLIILFCCQFIACLLPSKQEGIESRDNISYLSQTILDLFAYCFTILYFTFDRNSVIESVVTEPQSPRDTQLEQPANPQSQHEIQAQKKRAMKEKQNDLGLLVIASIFHVLFIVIGVGINIMHETKMCEFSIDYLISIVENILVFEILHLAIDGCMKIKEKLAEIKYPKH